MNEERLTRLLGWFSLGLGFPSTTIPNAIAGMIGVRDDAQTLTVLRLVGVREITYGLGILTRRSPDGWVWARVAGDAMDLSLMGRALATNAPRKIVPPRP